METAKSHNAKLTGEISISERFQNRVNAAKARASLVSRVLECVQKHYPGELKPEFIAELTKIVDDR